MAKTEETKTTPAAPTASRTATVEPETPQEPSAYVRHECVVSVEEAGYGHLGLATPGSKVCSRHAMHYKADGTKR